VYLSCNAFEWLAWAMWCLWCVPDVDLLEALKTTLLGLMVLRFRGCASLLHFAFEWLMRCNVAGVVSPCMFGLVWLSHCL
jgi:hypothetical protein